MAKKKRLAVAIAVSLFVLSGVLYESTGTVAGTLILVPFVVAVAVIAILGLAVRYWGYGRVVILNTAARATGWNTGTIPTSWWLLLGTFAIGLALGLAFYADRVEYFSSKLTDAYCRADVIRTLLSSEPGGYPGKVVVPRLHPEYSCMTDWRAKLASPPKDLIALRPLDIYRLLRHFGLLSEDETRGGPKGLAAAQASGASNSPNRATADTVTNPNFKLKYTFGVPTLDFIIALGETQSAERQTPGSEVTWTRLALASYLARLPAQSAWSPTPLWRVNNQPAKCPQGTTPQDCDMQGQRYVGSLATSGRHGLIAERPQDLTAYQLTDTLNRWTNGGKVGAVTDAMDGDALAVAESIPRFQAALFDSLRNDDGVRKEMVFVNAIVGPERALIIVLGFWFVALLMARAVQALPHRAHRFEIQKWLAVYEDEWRTNAADAPKRLAMASALHLALSQGENVSAEALNTAISNAGRPIPASNSAPSNTFIRTIPSALLDAAIQEMKSRQQASTKGSPSNLPDTRSIETAAEGLQGTLRRSRLVFDALLPTFPAIGFIATVSSLLTAMSKADQIVKAADPIARGIATSIVTDTLSLCFASTFMALVCLVILTPLSMRQEGIEQQLIGDTEADLQRVLKPEQP
jgi:MotA/TolQ/ExbB proton channel family protein